MKVAVDCTFLGAGRGGDETFLQGLLEGLALRRASTDEFPLLLARGPAPADVRYDPAFPRVAMPVHSGSWYFGVALPAALRRMRPDLVVTLTHAPVTGTVPNALTLGDLSFLHRPQDYPRRTALRLRTLLPRHARKARVVLVPSAYTRSDVIDTLGLAPDRVMVVPNRVAAKPLTDPEKLEADAWLVQHGVGRPYLLYLGNLHPRKNVPALIRSFLTARRTVPDLREHQLVIAGGHWWGRRDEESAAAGSEHVVFLGRVSDVVRTRLLERAAALAYLSLFEGFGLPPLEAMAHGTPVLASRLTSLPEVCGDAALLVDPLDKDEVLDGVVRLLTDVSLRRDLASAGPVRAATYDVARVGEAAMAAFAVALDRPHPPGVSAANLNQLGDHR